MKKEYIYVFLALLLVIGIKMLPLLSNEYCLWWDCPYYLKNVAEGNILHEADPLFFMIAAPLNMIVGNEILTVKLLMITMAIAFSLGTYLLSRKFMPVNYSISAMMLANFMFGLNRMWFDQYRNYLMLAILPFFLYYYLDENPKSTKISIILLGFMSVAHPSFAILFPAMILYALFQKNDHATAKTVKIIVYGLMIYTFLYAFIFSDMFGLFGWGSLAMSSLAANSAVNFGVTISNLSLIMTYTYMLFIPVLIYSLIRFKEKNISLFIFMFIAMFFGCMMPFSSLSTIAERVAEIMGFPIAIIVSYMFYKEFESQKGFKTAIYTVMLIGLLIFSFSHVSNIPDFVNDEEHYVYNYLQNNSNSYIVTTAREKYWCDYLLGEDYNYDYVEWEVLLGQKEPWKNIDPIFVGNKDTAYATLKNISDEYGNVYVFFTYARDPVSQEMFDGKDYFKIVYQEGTTILLKFESS